MRTTLSACSICSERHDEIELVPIIAGVFEARGLQFAASQVRRAIARVEQGT